MVGLSLLIRTQTRYQTLKTILLLDCCAEDKIRCFQDREKKPKKPKKPKKSGQFYSDSDSDSGSSSSESDDDLFPDFELDPDHRLLLRCAQPLLQSRNNGVCELSSISHNNFVVVDRIGV